MESPAEVSPDVVASEPEGPDVPSVGSKTDTGAPAGSSAGETEREGELEAWEGPVYQMEGARASEPPSPSNPDRPLKGMSNVGLAEYAEAHEEDRRQLQDVLDELTHRSSKGARQVRVTVEELMARLHVESKQMVTPESGPLADPCPICNVNPVTATFRGKPVCDRCREELRGTG